MDTGAVAVALAAGVAVVAAVPLGDVRWTLALLVLATGLGLGIADASSAPDVTDAFALALAAAGGIVFARVFDEPALALGVALLGVGLGIAGVGADAARAGDLDAPAAAWLAALACWAHRLPGLRGRATALVLAPLPAVAVAASTAADRAVPAVLLLAAGFLLVNADRLARGVRGSAVR